MKATFDTKSLAFNIETFFYNSRRSESLILKSLIGEITKVKNIEEKISAINEKIHYVKGKMTAS